MKKATIFILMFAFIFTLNIKQTFAQNPVLGGYDEYDDPIPVFWFYISIRETKNIETQEKKYIVRRLGTKVESGSLDEYEKDLWLNLSKGYKLAIGPFPLYEEAKQAMEFYVVTEEKTFSEGIDQNRTVHFFPIRVFRMERSNALEIQKSPSAVAPGNAQGFYEALKTQLDFKAINIGPFWSAEVAEEAKRLYRLQ